MKLKSLWCSFFQVQNTYMITKSIKHIDAPSLANEDDLNDYRIRREKNNESVRKSRAKNRVKLQECASHVQELRKENSMLNKHLDGLQAELLTLKGLFQHCFSFNLNNLAIKPSEIPTSALYKVIMKKDLNSQEIVANPGFSLSEHPSTYERNMNTSNNAANNKNDQFYIDQIKNALTNIVKQEKNSNIVVAPTPVVTLVRDHDYIAKSGKKASI